jgi:hypothetical protein
MHHSMFVVAVIGSFADEVQAILYNVLTYKYLGIFSTVGFSYTDDICLLQQDFVAHRFPRLALITLPPLLFLPSGFCATLAP